MLKILRKFSPIVAIDVVDPYDDGNVQGTIAGKMSTGGFSFSIATLSEDGQVRWYTKYVLMDTMAELSSDSIC